MKRFFLPITAGLIIFSASASAPLAGFLYGEAAAPGGHEWQSPDSLALNKEQPRATFSYFANLKNALKVLPENSSYVISLDGKWKFKWVGNPEERPAGFQNPTYNVSKWDDITVPSNWNIAGIEKDGTLRYGKPIYVNQKVIFQHLVKPDDWRGGVMRTPPETWTTYKDRNEVGSYRRNFTIPTTWDGREIYIQFDGVDSFFYLWINGKYVGFSKNSRNAARFDITPYVKKGNNTVAVEVYRSSDGSFFEAQDMFRLPGIFRSVSLYSTSKLQISDVVAIPDVQIESGTRRVGDNAPSWGETATLRVTTTLRNMSRQPADGCKVRYLLYPNPKLYSDSVASKPVAELTLTSRTIPAGGACEAIGTLKVQDPKLWSPEEPWRYTLVVSAGAKNFGKPDYVSLFTGLRKIEIKDTPAAADEFGKAGRYWYLNGKPMKLKGVNRHETDPQFGHALTREKMEQDVMMMKRANINHVRDCHYPDAPYWYYLCEKYGIALEDEANLESHEYYYGKASLSHVKELEPAHVARVMEMAHSTVNSPAIVIWSLGNEAGPGDNFVTAYKTLKSFDSSRPVQYERNNNIVDIGSNQYPDLEWVKYAASGTGDIKYPFHISEYAHSMGNAVGTLADIWQEIETSNFIMGGAIWDWIDQSLYNYDPATGERYLAFGGDFGDYPTDGQFVMNGLIFGDRTPKPQYHEVKKVYHNADITKKGDGEIEVFNKNYYTTLDEYDAVWSLQCDGKEVANGTMDITGIAPRGRKVIKIAEISGLPTDKGEYLLNVELRLKNDKPWAKAGYVQMAGQVHMAGEPLFGKTLPKGKMPTVEKTGTGTVLETGDVKATFSHATGTLTSLTKGGKELLFEGNGPQPDLFRAYMNNDPWISEEWFKNGLYNLKHKVTAIEHGSDENNNPTVSFVIESRAPRGGKMTGGNGNARGTYDIVENDSVQFGPDDFTLTTQQTWTALPDGTLVLDTYMNSNKPELVLPRLGYSMMLPAEFEECTWYGYGPEENYNDRKAGQQIGLYTRKVKDMATHYTRPQSNGNREGVHLLKLSNNGGGIEIYAPEGMSATAIPYTEQELFFTDHDYKLPDMKRIVVHLDAGVTGIGGASCGQDGPIERDRIKADGRHFRLVFKPI